LNFVVEVVKAPTIKVDSVTLAGASLPLFNGNYVVAKDKVDGAGFLNFTLDGLTADNYYTLTAQVLKSAAVNQAPTTESTIAITGLPTTFTSLKDLTRISLGTLDETSVVDTTYVKYTLSFFSKIANKALTPGGTGYSPVGNPIVINVMVDSTPNRGAIATVTQGTIREGVEAGSTFLVNLLNDTFITGVAVGAAFTGSHYALTDAQSTGVTITSMVKINSTTAVVTLGANSNADYDVNEDLTLTLRAAALTLGDADITVEFELTAVDEAAPAAPAISGTETTNATANNFLFAIVTGYADLADYEISLNNGTNWTQLAASTVITTPSITVTAGVSSGVITVGGLTGTYAVGHVQVRVKAAAASTTDSVGRFPAGTPLSNTVAFE
jgi:hypothetical protein